MKSLISLRAQIMRRNPRDDDGAMLLIALIIITTIALVTGAILAHGWANLRSTVALRGVAGTSYAADAAAKVALNDIRLGSTAPDWTTPGFNGMWGSSTGWVYTNNDDGTGCFGATGMLPRTALELDNLYPAAGDQASGTSARVECVPVDGTGILGSNGGVTINDPDATDPYAQALTTVGTSSDPHDGVYVDVLGSGNTNSAPVGGGILSKTNVTVDHGDLTTDGWVYANGSCSLGSGRVVSPDKQCPKSGGVSSSAVPTSPLGSAIPTLIDPTTITNCHFPAGAYVNGAALSTAVNNCDTAAHPVAYFDDTSKPYYFDFADGQPWDIATEVIGGVPTGSTTIPGACQSPIKFPNTAGVQFVFGGSSTMFIENTAQVEICGPSNNGDAPLTIYQQQADGASATTTTTPTATPTTTTTSFGPEPAGTVTTAPSVNNTTDAFVPATGSGSLTAAMLANADGTAGAKWKSTKTKNNGELDLAGFADSIPAGATITSASLSIALTARSSDVTPTVYMNGQTAAVGTATSTTSANVLDVKAALTAALPATGTLAPTVQIKIPTGGTGSGMYPAKDSTVTVDQVTLTVTYTTTSTPPTPPVTTTVKIEKATNTTFIQTKANSKAQFVVQGATYAPQGYLVISPGNDPNALFAFRWGLVAQAVNFGAQPQQLFGYPLVSIPKAGKGLGTRVTAVDLKVWVCVESSTCSSGGTMALTVRALISDPPYNTSGTYNGVPQPGRRQIKVLSWAEQR